MDLAVKSSWTNFHSGRVNCRHECIELRQHEKHMRSSMQLVLAGRRTPWSRQRFFLIRTDCHIAQLFWSEDVMCIYNQGQDGRLLACMAPGSVTWTFFCRQGCADLRNWAQGGMGGGSITVQIRSHSALCGLALGCAGAKHSNALFCILRCCLSEVDFLNRHDLSLTLRNTKSFWGGRDSSMSLPKSVDTKSSLM